MLVLGSREQQTRYPEELERHQLNPQEKRAGRNPFEQPPKVRVDEGPMGKYGNAHLIHSNTPEEVRRLKTMPGKDIVTFGSPRLVESLAEAGLVDRFRIWLHPTLLGNGKPFFRGKNRVNLRLVGSKVYKNGVVALDYEPAPTK